MTTVKLQEFVYKPGRSFVSVLVDEASEAVDMDKDNTINLEEKLGNAAKGLQSCSLDMCEKLGREHHGV